MSKINLVWGESVAVRDEFINNAPGQLLMAPLRSLDYSPFIGDNAALDLTRDHIMDQYGKNYKHVFLTNGAAGGCTISMRAYEKLGKKMAITFPAPYFSLYPAMISSAGLRHITNDSEMTSENCVALIDSPANPTGEYRMGPVTTPVIWDAVYANGVYTSIKTPRIAHDILVGSWSKYTGMNGLRLGWIATDDDLLAKTIAELVAAEYCGLSVPSTYILNEISKGYDFELFEQKARIALDRNREEWAKLEKYFDGLCVSPVGMFYYGPMDQAAQKLFTKAGIEWTKGSALGTVDSMARFNIGQSNKIVKFAVASVLKADKVR